jgi:putative transposase
MRHSHLYVIVDIFSRYVVGWMIAARESAALAEQIIADTAHKQCIIPGTLTLHADRGSSMRSKPVAALLVDLDISKPTAARTSRMTIRTRRASSKP